MKKKYVVLSLVGVAILIAFPSVLYLMGFRITYAPALENSWDAVSAFAAWAGVIVSIISVGVSGLAIYYAIQVPKKIADRQDKIALFEKRYECYMAIQRITTFSESIENAETAIQIQSAFVISLGCSSDYFKKADFSDLVFDFQNIETTLLSGTFLFENFDLDALQKLLKYILLFTKPLLQTKESEFEKCKLSVESLEQRDRIVMLSRQFRSKCMNAIEIDLNLRHEEV